MNISKYKKLLGGGILGVSLGTAYKYKCNSINKATLNLQNHILIKMWKKIVIVKTSG